MYIRHSKLTKIVILFNIIFAIGLFIVCAYYFREIQISNNIILDYMAETGMDKDSAIMSLQEAGVELVIGGGFAVSYGMFVAIASSVLLLFYAKNGGFLLGFITALSCVWLSFVGGFLLFYVMLSGKGEKSVSTNTFALRDGWEKFIHKRAETEA